MIAFPVHILSEHEAKPAFGQPCNQCGLCCRVQACRVSKEILRSDQAPCIALEVHDGKFLCGMVRRPEHYLNLSHLGQIEVLRKWIAQVLEIGAGCSMDDFKFVRVEVVGR